MDADEAIQLTDWRRQVADLYALTRSLGGDEIGWEAWRTGKQRLYGTHSQSPVPPEARAGYVFPTFPYDPSMRTASVLVASPPEHRDGDGGVPGMTHVGALVFVLRGSEHSLGAYWLDGYAGGLFVPFADATSGTETYGGGRYILDTAKGADLGCDGDRVVLDFNFAYAPSCAHDPRWRCPLAPSTNRLDVAVRAGERTP